VLFAVTILVFLNLSMRGSIQPYYFHYYVTQQQSAFSLNVFGLPLQFDLFSLFNITGVVCTIIGIFFSKPLAIRFGKRDTFGLTLFLTALFTVAFYFVPRDAIVPLFVLQVLLWLVYGVTVPLLWAMMADVADYSEWLTGRRATGIAFSATVFGLKFGLGVGGALTGWLLSLAGYVPNVAQSASALQSIRVMMSVGGAAFFFLAVGLLLLYPIDRTLERQMDIDLNERRKNFVTA
jgi:Na+/melibiose symporter-like transporter